MISKLDHKGYWNNLQVFCNKFSGPCYISKYGRSQSWKVFGFWHRLYGHCLNFAIDPWSVNGKDLTLFKGGGDNDF